MLPRKFFISYAHAEAEERELAAWLHDALITNGHTAFMDTGILVGTRWADEIERRIHWCDFLIVLLSAAASASEMVTEEVKRARDRHRTHGSPVIIPLRVRYDGDPGYTLSALLGPIQWARWESDNDSPRILQAILHIAAVLAFDEADRVFDRDYRRDFFTMLRSWQNRRARSQVWRRLGLALVISTERNLLIDDATASPFNIGLHVVLRPFSLVEGQQLNERYQQLSGFALTAEEVVQLWELLGGQPYLTRQAYHALATEQVPSFPGLLNDASHDDSIFADHLRAILKRLSLRPDYRLATAFRQIIHGRKVSAPAAVPRLQSAGLVRRDGTRYVPASKRRALRAEQHEHRDQALLWWARALSVASNETRARAMGQLLGADYPQLHMTLRHERPVRAVTFSPDGHTLLTGVIDGTARLWDAATGHPLTSLHHEAAVLSVAFSPDGCALLIATQWWLHAWRKSGDEWQPFAHRLLPGSMKWDAKFFFPDPAATQIRAALGVTGDALQIVTIRLDGYDAEPVQGNPQVLLEEWQKRLGLRINEAGEIVPAHQ